MAKNQNKDGKGEYVETGNELKDLLAQSLIEIEEKVEKSIEKGADDKDDNPIILTDEGKVVKKVEEKKGDDDDDDEEKKGDEPALTDDELIEKAFFGTDDKDKDKGKEKPASESLTAEQKAKLEAYDKLMEDEGVKIVLNARKEGKNVIDVINEVAGNDPSTMTDEQLLEAYLLEAKVKPENIRHMMTSMTDLEQHNAIEKQREILLSQRLAKLKSLSPVAVETNAEREELVKKNKAIIAQNIEKVMTENSENIFKNTLVKLDANNIKELNKFFAESESFITMDENGMPDANELVEFAIFKKYRKLMLTNAIKAGMNLKAKEIESIEGKNAGRGNQQGSVRTSVKKTQEKELDDLTKDIAAKRGVTFID